VNTSQIETSGASVLKGTEPGERPADQWNLLVMAGWLTQADIPDRWSLGCSSFAILRTRQQPAGVELPSNVFASWGAIG
jgi:hypothetical protein